MTYNSTNTSLYFKLLQQTSNSSYYGASYDGTVFEQTIS